jgi:hypothetical protein
MADFGHGVHQFGRDPQIRRNLSPEEARQRLDMTGLEPFCITVYKGNGKSPSLMSTLFSPIK